MRRLRRILRSILDRIFSPYTLPVERRLERLEQALKSLHQTVAQSNAISTSTAREPHELDQPSLSYLLNVLDERSQTLHAHGIEIIQSVRRIEEQAKNTRDVITYVDTRTQSLLYQAIELSMANDYQMDLLRRFYLETHPRRKEPLITGMRSLNLHAAQMTATDSADHLLPESTVEGVSRPTTFVNHIIEVLGSNVNALDLGTGAAGFVFEMQQMGISAYGVDGSDFCRSNGIGYWPLLGPYLFTCDITKPFSFKDLASQERQRFELITAWEVLEHIPAEGVPSLLENIKSNLSEGGYFIGSISMIEYVASNGTPYHVSLLPKSKWRDIFADNGLKMIDDSPFNPRLFYRGNGPRFQDRHNYFDSPEDGFHFVAVMA